LAIPKVVHNERDPPGFDFWANERPSANVKMQRLDVLESPIGEQMPKLRQPAVWHPQNPRHQTVSRSAVDGTDFAPYTSKTPPKLEVLDARLYCYSDLNPRHIDRPR
jgi:hypothetical protein